MISRPGLTRSTLSTLCGAALLFSSACIVSEKRNTRYVAYYQNFTEVEAPRPTWVYWGQETHSLAYQNYYIDRVEMYEDTADKVSREDRADFDLLASQLRRIIEARFEKSFPLVSEPGKDTLILHFSIVDIKPSAWFTNERGREIHIADTKTKGVKFELDCRDGKTNRRVFAISTHYEGPAYEAHQDISLLPFVEEGFSQWREWLRPYLLKAQKETLEFIPVKK